MSNAVWMVRINPLTRCRLADPHLATVVEELVARAHAARPLADAASDDLHHLVPAVDETWRGRLLALRRDIHNLRDPAPVSLPFELPASVDRWTANHRALQSCRAQLRDGYPAALERERHNLSDLLGNDDFLITLARSAAGVYDAALRYRSHAQRDSKDRKAERSLLQYLTRAMVRTSPYGRFTAVGLTDLAPGAIPMHDVSAMVAPPATPSSSATPSSWASATPQATPPSAPSAMATAQVELDRPLFDYVVGGLMPAAGDALLGLAPTARVSDDRVTFFQMGQGALRQLSASRTDRTEALVRLLDLGPRRRSSLAVGMALELGIEVADADRLIGSALGLGLLVTLWRGDEFVAGPVEAALRDLAVDDQGHHLHLDALNKLRASLGRLGDGGTTTSRDRIAALSDLDATVDALSQAAQRPARLSVNEDFVLGPLTVDPASSASTLDDLADVAAMVWVFDRALVTRTLLAATLAERFGPGCRVPLVEHAESLAKAVYQAERLFEEHPDALLGPDDGSLAALAKLRRDVLATWRDAIALAEDGEVELRPAVAADLAGAVPERFLADPASYAMVVQFAGGLGGPGRLAVLNDAYAGHGPMVSRFLQADAERGGTARQRLRDYLLDLCGGGRRLVEDRGQYRLAINVHPPVLDDGLDPEGWHALQLEHDPETDTVRIVDRDGMPVTVLTLGAQLPELFPYPVRLAAWMCSSGRVVLDIPGRLRRQARRDRAAGGSTRLRGDAGAAAADQHTVSVPRLRIGQVVLSRRQWYPGADFPDAIGRDDIDYLLALSDWRARHGVPAEIVLKSLFDGPTVWENLSNPQARELFLDLRRQSKPQYVDLASAALTRVLPRLIERRPAGCIEEAMPGLAGGGHATEWMVTVSRSAGESGFGWMEGVNVPHRASRAGSDPTTASRAGSDPTTASVPAAAYRSGVAR